MFEKHSGTSATGQVSLSLTSSLLSQQKDFSLRKVTVPSVQFADEKENKILPYCSMYHTLLWTLTEAGIFWPKKKVCHRTLKHYPNIYLLEDPTTTALAALILTFPIFRAQTATSVLLNTAFVGILYTCCTHHIPNELFITNYFYYVSVSSMTLIF